MRSQWFTMGFLDVAGFYIILSNAAAHRDQLQGVKEGEKGIEAEKYHLLALERVNSQLAQTDLGVSDGLIGAVSGFVCHNVSIGHTYFGIKLTPYQSVVGNYDQWLLHLDGISKLVAMRGGLESLSTQSLRETISW
jgi:hypothetical protein